MIRSDVLREIAPIIRDHLVVCNIGLPSQELHMIDDQPSNFYMLGTICLLYTSPSPRDATLSRMPSSA